MNTASCLSLISNAVLLWNTIKIREAVKSLKTQGKEVDYAYLKRISPLLRKHFISHGTYNFKVWLCVQYANVTFGSYAPLPDNGVCPPTNWEEFKNSPQDLIGSSLFGSLQSREVDFSLSNRNWKDTAFKVGNKIATATILTCLIGGFPLLKWGLGKISFLQRNRFSAFFLRHQSLLTKIGEISFPILFSLSVIRYLGKNLILFFLYPTQSRWFKKMYHSEKNLIPYRAALVSSKDFLSRDVVLEKNGTRYSGILMGHKDTIHNGKWVLHTTGNAEIAEISIMKQAKPFHESGFNMLIVMDQG